MKTQVVVDLDDKEIRDLIDKHCREQLGKTVEAAGSTIQVDIDRESKTVSASAKFTINGKSTK